jgi:DNA-binding transcriptional MerR regulator
MDYTVSQLAQMSGVSNQTLRYYDKIGLLSPAYLADNGYRYYQREQLLLLQQILFYRELGFKLETVQQLLDSSSFDNLLSLYLQKKKLLQELDRYQSLLKTIDKTILNLQGEITMSDRELFDNISNEQIEQQKHFARKYMGEDADSMLDDMRAIEKDLKLTNEDKLAKLERISEICAAFEKLITAGESPMGEAAQSLMAKHYQEDILPYYQFTQEQFKQFIKMQIEHPTYKEHFNKVHKDFAQFYYDTAVEFANVHLD